MLTRLVLLLVAAPLLLVPVTSVMAVAPDEVLSDPQLEQRARALSAELRCMVCQNQSIDDSDASLAKDLRVLVRERIVAGDSDAQVIDYLVSRYGEFVLLKPRMAWHTLALWIAGPLALIAGIAAIIVGLRRQKGQASAAAANSIGLSAAEQEELERILKDGPGTS